MSCWIKIGAAFQSASDVAVVQRPGENFTFITMFSKNPKHFIANVACCVCVLHRGKFWLHSGVSMEIFLFFSGPEPQEQKHS